MSSIVLSGDTSGTITLDAPAVAGTTLLTLPTTNGTLGLAGASVARSQLPAGSVLQVVQSIKTDAFTTTSTAYTIPTGLSVAITPTSSTSKVLVMVNINFEVNGDSGHAYAALQRNGTSIFVGDAAGNRNRATFVSNNYSIGTNPAFSMQFLDSPATTSSITYSIPIKSSNGTTVFLNRSARDNDGLEFDGRSVSSIIVMEIAG